MPRKGRDHRSLDRKRGLNGKGLGIDGSLMICSGECQLDAMRVLIYIMIVLLELSEQTVNNCMNEE